MYQELYDRNTTEIPCTSTTQTEETSITDLSDLVKNMKFTVT